VIALQITAAADMRWRRVRRNWLLEAVLEAGRRCERLRICRRGRHGASLSSVNQQLDTVLIDTSRTPRFRSAALT
jgi:hypothetical protein